MNIITIRVDLSLMYFVNDICTLKTVFLLPTHTLPMYAGEIVRPTAGSGEDTTKEKRREEERIWKTTEMRSGMKNNTLLRIGTEAVERVHNYTSLGSVASDTGGCEEDICSRIKLPNLEQP